MLHVIIGITAIVVGLWGISRNWYMFLDMLLTMLPAGMIIFGIVALLAGLRSMRSNVEQADG